MKECLGRSGDANRSTRPMISVWPRLMALQTAAAYISLGISTLRDYCTEGILQPVTMPGSTLRDKSGNIIASGKTRRISKILIDRQDLDRLIDSRRGNES